MRKTLNNILQNKWLRDILIILLVYSMLIFKSWEHRYNYAGGFTEYLFENGITCFVILSIVYFNHLVLIPTLFEKKRYIFYGLAITGFILVFSYLQDLHCGCNAVKAKFFYYLLTTGIGMAVLFYNRYIKQESNLKEKELLQRQMELNYLKSQVNPHFMFNSLNSVYVLSRQKSDATPEVVLQLSQLMRYQLESSKQQLVSLKEELEFIQNYLFLEELRLGDRCRVEFQIEGEVEGQLIAPMLLIPFVENAFKHGANSTRGKSEIEVSIYIKEKDFQLKVCNTKPKNKRAHHPFKRNNGIGLVNVKKRLSLLYPNHSLQLKDTLDSFESSLVLELVEISKKKSKEYSQEM